MTSKLLLLEAPFAAAPTLFEDLTARGCIITELPLNLQKMESLLMQRALAESRGNVAKAARLLGINRTRIYRKFQESLTLRTAPLPDA